MKHILLFFCLSIISLNGLYGQEKIDNIDELQSQSLENDLPILIVFSGSDWCKPCIQLDRDILQSQEFKDFEINNLIVYKADFPYQKKNKPSKNQQKMNESLADKFNATGTFPNIVLIDAELSLITQLHYNTGMTPTQFIHQLKTVL